MSEQDDTQDKPMNSGLGVAERDLLLSELHALPDTPPPREVWQRIAAQAAAEGLLRSPQRPGQRRWFLGAGLAAAVLLAALSLPGLLSHGVDDDAFPTEPAYVENRGNEALAALMVQSRLLERNLRALPAKPNVMRVGTAATIDELESRIAVIDRALNNPATGQDEAQTEQYWRERVRLMDSLLQLRYAQARRSSM